jgi:hypothetical protein
VKPAAAGDDHFVSGRYEAGWMDAVKRFVCPKNTILKGPKMDQHRGIAPPPPVENPYLKVAGRIDHQMDIPTHRP